MHKPEYQSDYRPAFFSLKFLAVLTLVMASMPIVAQATFTVNSTGDSGDFLPGNGFCNDGSATAPCARPSRRPMPTAQATS